MENKEKDFEEFKKNVSKIIWQIFVFARVPVILVWISLLLGIIIGTKF